MNFIKKLFIFFKREAKLFYSNIVDLFSNILFFFLSIFVFIFALGTEAELLKTIGVGIIWSLLLLSSTLSLRKFYEDDFKKGILIVMHMGGISYELIVFLKIISHFIFVQIPFLVWLHSKLFWITNPSCCEVDSIILMFLKWG